MNSQIHELPFQAAMLYSGFLARYFSRADVERWAEKQIEKADQPSTQLIELVILRGKHDQDVLSLLASLSHGVDTRTSAKLAIGFIGRAYRENRISLEPAIKALYTLLRDYNYDFSSEEQLNIYGLDDGYDLAIAGTWGTIAEVTDNFLHFTEPYAAAVVEATIVLST